MVRNVGDCGGRRGRCMLMLAVINETSEEGDGEEGRRGGREGGKEGDGGRTSVGWCGVKGARMTIHARSL